MRKRLKTRCEAEEKPRPQTVVTCAVINNISVICPTIHPDLMAFYSENYTPMA